MSSISINRDAKNNFIPKSIICLKNYSRKTFLADLLAGVTVGLVALPLALAFAIASGVSPQVGLYTAIISGFLISALGGSKVQIGGPTGAFVVVVYGIISQYGIDGLFTCTFMAGLMLLAMGIGRFGSAVKFIPRPVVIGFTNGIAILIASTQLKEFFGLEIEQTSGDFIGRIAAVVSNLEMCSLAATSLASFALLALILLKIFAPRIPGPIIVLVAGTLIASSLGLPVQTIHSRFGDIPNSIPQFQIPNFRFDLFFTLISPAITVAMLGAIESLLSAVVADRMSGDKHNSNVELFAQGVANLVSPFLVDCQLRGQSHVPPRIFALGPRLRLLE